MANYRGDDANAAAQFAVRNGINLGTPSIIRALAMTEEETYKLDEWDLPPELMFFTMETMGDIEDSPLDPADPAKVLVTATTRVGSLPLPEGGGAQIARVLDAEGHLIVRFLREMVPGVPIGFAIICEAWGLSVPAGDLDEELRLMSLAGSIEDQPGRTELRVMTAVVWHFNIITVSRTRGASSPRWRSTRRATRTPPAGT